MSHAAISAALALEGASLGERQAAFALASYANREHRAWPRTRLAAARAGLSRSQYLAARNGLEGRGLIAIEEQGGGRGQSPVIRLTFAERGARVDREINAPLFERTLGYSRAKGSARLLLATLAALADSELRVVELSTEQLCLAAEMSDSTYRRARAALLASGEVQFEVVGGGRAKTNTWLLQDPGAEAESPVRASVPRRGPVPGQRPLVGAVKGPGLTGVSIENPGQDRTVSSLKGPGFGGVSELNPGQTRMVLAETPPQTPPETPSPYARAGSEPQNQTTNPPDPQGGNPTQSVTVTEHYVSDRGRRRQRQVVISLDAVRAQLQPPNDADHADWQRARAELKHLVGDSTFEIWLDSVELGAVNQSGCLLLVAPDGTRSWISHRFSRVFARVGSSVGREVRLADERESQLLDALTPSPVVDRPDSSAASLLSRSISDQRKEAV